MLTVRAAADDSIVVESHYDKQVLDMEAEELLDDDAYDTRANIHHSLHQSYNEDGEDDRTDGDEYGGMAIDLYDSIVEYKRNGTYPASSNTRHDRSALSHWRSRCLRFVLADDNETLLYYNPGSSVNDQPKVVVKKGEVRRVLERIHDLIGHLGQKRTQIVVLKKLHWRSVRQDVKTYINSCGFCNQKKLEGKKILKAPVDVTSDGFDINIEVRSKPPDTDGIYERLSFNLIGYNEQEVRAAAITRMTSYTFKETAPDLRGRFARPQSVNQPSPFRRQPYIKRTRYSPYASGFILPYAPKHKNDGPEFIEIFQDGRGQSSTPFNGEDYEPVDDLVEAQGSSRVMVPTDVQIEIPTSIAHPSLTNVKNEVVSESGPVEQGHVISKRLSSRPSSSSFTMRRRKTAKSSSALGLASRFNLALGDVERIDPSEHAELSSPYDSLHTRPEMAGLAPIMLMPSVDAEVIHLQKELLARQIRLQRLQEKVLQAQFESMRIPIARYEEIDPNGEQVQIIDHDGEVIEEGVEVDQELNVMDSDDEEDRELPAIKNYNQNIN